MKKVFTFLILVICFLPTTLYGDGYQSRAKAILGKFKHEPNVRQVHKAALRYALINQSRIRSLINRSRFAGWLPEMRLLYRRHIEDDRDTDFPTPTSPILTSQQTDLDQRYEIRLTWDLDKLVFNSNEIGVYKELKRMVELRSDILKEVTKLYFERRRLQVLLLINPPRTLLARVRRMLRLQELSADLDALTGGFFGKKIKSAGK